mmetsp:Transcript_25100/g.52334  ORF Transcript_25100/g.52334 Transcript_25100/m.52334 type:complete len:169 (-) Transcript_25100:324-830(-)
MSWFSLRLLNRSALRVENIELHVRTFSNDSDRDLLHSFLDDSVKLAKVQPPMDPAAISSPCQTETDCSEDVCFKGPAHCTHGSALVRLIGSSRSSISYVHSAVAPIHLKGRFVGVEKSFPVHHGAWLFELKGQSPAKSTSIATTVLAWLFRSLMNPLLLRVRRWMLFR